MDLDWVNVDTLCAGVDTDADPVVINLSEVSWLEPFAVVYLGMFMRHQRSMGKSLSVVLPKAAQARAYLSSQNFWQRFSFDPASVEAAGLKRLTIRSSLSDIVDIEKRPRVAEEASDAVLALLRTTRAHVDNEEIAVMVAELVDNFAQHSGETLAVFMMQYYGFQAAGDAGYR